MKCIPAISALAFLSLAACETMTGPVTNGGYNPLLPAGSGNRSTPTTSTTFKTRPKGDADADKLLTRGSSMKVISTSDSYVKVELDSGEVGFVPSVMLEDPNAATQTPTTAPGEYQIYPPLPGNGFGQPLPVVEPAGPPPEGAIPTVIDPDAPAATTPVPPVEPKAE
jgi:hypothetical protein